MISRLYRKPRKRHLKPETLMWKENYLHIQELWIKNNKTLYEVAHEKDRLLHLITLAIRMKLDSSDEK